MSATVLFRISVALIMTLAMFSATTVSAQGQKIVPKQAAQQIPKRAGDIGGTTARGQPGVDRIPNPHWQPAACPACHSKKPTKKALYLRNNNSERLCNRCHESVSPHSYIHPVGMRVDKKMLARMPVDFRKAIAREKGRVGCRTCHDLTISCIPERASEQHSNPRFFRGGPYKTRTDLCYLCHDATKYERLNPHDQLTKAGKVKAEKCLVCHESGDKLKKAKNIVEVDFNMKADLSKMCTGCHPYDPHPGGSFSFRGKGPPNHLVHPNNQFLKRMEAMSRKNDIILPLEPGSNNIFCGTCHNPHQKGVITRTAAARGAGSRHRLRMQEMCANCHDK